jgi:hypothetical protein
MVKLSVKDELNSRQKKIEFSLEKVLKDGRDIPLDDLESTAIFFQNQNNHLLAGKFFMFAQNYDRVFVLFCFLTKQMNLFLIGTNTFNALYWFK